jgi:hypothetical protein
MLFTALSFPKALRHKNNISRRIGGGFDFFVVLNYITVILFENNHPAPSGHPATAGN